MATETAQDWDAKYRNGDTPWEMAGACERLTALVQTGVIRPCRALELGCGTGANAVFLAQLGFQVTALDLAPTAIERARQLAAEQDVTVEFVCADLTQWASAGANFDFVYDRGCYHAVRRANCTGYMATISRVSKPGARILLLAGNAAELSPAGQGPPRVTEDEIRSEFAPWFDIERLEPFFLQGRQGEQGPLFWSCLMVRLHV